MGRGIDVVVQYGIQYRQRVEVRMLRRGRKEFGKSKRIGVLRGGWKESIDMQSKMVEMGREKKKDIAKAGEQVCCVVGGEGS
jgi:hypothetical protein